MKKLMNKYTGEIGYLYANKNENYNVLDRNDKVLAVYMTLKAVGEHWEDVEESKEHYWVIDDDGVLVCRAVGDFANEEMCKHIGNYFENEEEAKKAVKKLEAWKRLKDKGFRFIPEASYIEEQSKETVGSMMFVACTMNDYRDFVFGDNADIKLLFGGHNEEEVHAGR